MDGGLTFPSMPETLVGEVLPKAWVGYVFPKDTRGNLLGYAAVKVCLRCPDREEAIKEIQGMGGQVVDTVCEDCYQAENRRRYGS